MTAVEPVVAEELWNQCNAILDERRRHRKAPARKGVHPFAGVTVCNCGGKMYLPSNSPKFVCRACKNKIPAADLEAIFHEQLEAFFFSPERIAAYLEQADRVLADKAELLGVLATERSRVEREMDKIYHLYLNDGITKEGFGKRYKPLEARLKEIEGQVPQVQAERDILKIHYLSSDQIVQDAQDLCTNWGQLPAEMRRDIVEQITEKIVVGDSDVEITLQYLPPLPGEDSEANSLDTQATDKPQVTQDKDGNDGSLATRPHGFMAATNCTRAG